MRMRVEMQRKLAGGDNIKGRQQVQRRETRMRRATENQWYNIASYQSIQSLPRLTNKPFSLP